MRATATWAAPMLVLAMLAASGCEARVKPESQQVLPDAPRATPSAASTPPTSSPSPTPLRTLSPRPSPSRRPPQPAPSVGVPELSIPPRPQRPVEGGDVSWPQCPKGMGIPQKPSQGLPMPLPSARFVVLGLTNGPAFTPNPCLRSQVDWVKQRSLLAAAYAVHSFPDDQTLRRHGSSGPYDARDRLGALANVGYQQARYNLATMRGAGLQSPIVWIDVEPVPVFEWSGDQVANAAVVRGAARAYTDAGSRIGTYSTAYLWEQVVGSLRLGIPEWRAAGQTSRAEALRRCRRDRVIQGGEAVLAQWVESSRDRNVTCPGTAAEMLRWFHQY